VSSPAATRRLAAVLIADVAGYSRLMEQDEAGTHERLTRIRAEVTDPAVQRHGGRIVRSVGDGFLVEFHSAAAALQAAIDIQRALAERNRPLAPDRRIDHRIGINLGDILVDDHDIAGTGVNVAARLEALAPPGGIAVSGTVRELVRQDPGVRFVDAGEHRVKNISQRVRVFRVELDDGPPPAAPPLARSPARSSRRALRWAGASVALLALAVALWFTAMPKAPSAPPQMLVVLPFEHSSKDGAQDLAESMTRQVTSAVSQLSGVTVIAPAIAARYGVHRGEMRRIGRELNVRYALDGRVDRVGDEVRAAVHVIDTASGGSLWSSDLRAAASADGSAPLALVGQLSGSLRAAMRTAELKRIASGPESGSAYATALAAIDELERSTDENELPAIRAHFERALALDPQHVPALNGYAHTLVYLAIGAEAGAPTESLLAGAEQVSLQAVSLQPDGAEAWAARANVLFFRDRLDAAAEAVQRGLRLNPYLVMLHTFDGQIHLAQGRGEAALAAFDRAIELNPSGPLYGVQMHYRCRALLSVGQLDQAIDTCERGMAFGPEWSDYMLLAAAYALKGNDRRAAQARAELLRLKPGFTIRWHQGLPNRHAGPNNRYDARLYAGLRKAGVPEQ
jgi:class 3 adenylate cyclase/TolB-like protein/tetratricopeptide (TPR) repeat protein